MCGRFTTRKITKHGFEEILGEEEWKENEIPPRYNVGPGQETAVILKDCEKVVLKRLFWGFVPSWSKEPRVKVPTINARLETVEEKPMYRDAFHRQRCLVPADGYYEWLTDGKRKIPYFLHLPGDVPFAFAGLWDTWAGAGAEPFSSYTLLTTSASANLAHIHHRMPVLLPKEHWRSWLDPATPAGNTRKVLAKLVDNFELYTVSTDVNSIRNEGPELVTPVSQAIQGELF
jgi:putative SOS response-associated peptidase YedK